MSNQLVRQDEFVRATAKTATPTAELAFGSTQFVRSTVVGAHRCRSATRPARLVADGGLGRRAGAAVAITPACAATISDRSAHLTPSKELATGCSLCDGATHAGRGVRWMGGGTAEPGRWPGFVRFVRRAGST